MKHQHKYDANGKQLCCTLEEKINQETDIEIGCCAVDSKSEHSDDDGHDHDHSQQSESTFQNVRPGNLEFCVIAHCNCIR